MLDRQNGTSAVAHESCNMPQFGVSALLAAVQSLMHKNPRNRPVVAFHRLRLRSAHAVVGVDVMVDEVAQRPHGHVIRLANLGAPQTRYRHGYRLLWLEPAAPTCTGAAALHDVGNQPAELRDAIPCGVHQKLSERVTPYFFAADRIFPFIDDSCCAVYFAAFADCDR